MADCWADLWADLWADWRADWRADLWAEWWAEWWADFWTEARPATAIAPQSGNMGILSKFSVDNSSALSHWGYFLQERRTFYNCDFFCAAIWLLVWRWPCLRSTRLPPLLPLAKRRCPLESGSVSQLLRRAQVASAGGGALSLSAPGIARPFCRSAANRLIMGWAGG